MRKRRLISPADRNTDGCTEPAPAYPALHLWKEACRAHNESAQVQFAAYKQFCDDTSVEKKRAISEAEEQMEKLNADISKATADAARLGGHLLQSMVVEKVLMLKLKVKLFRAQNLTLSASR